MGGGMEVHKNKWIEDWSTGRENLELNFRWTRRNLAIVGLFGIALPILVYKGIVREFVRSPSLSLSFSFTIFYNLPSFVLKSRLLSTVLADAFAF